MVRRRSRVVIIMQILEYLSNGCSRPTKIATALNLAYDRLDNMLNQLKDAGLVEFNNDEYCITRRGLRLLDEYRRFRDLAKSFGIEID